jgi:aspartyl-tRNA(Asn)/glutamyl-tRNA(Gln) amidotransferase subunit B
VINQAAIEACIRTGVALNCEIPAFSKLDRKNYVYPDLPKGYQVSQYDLPFCLNGWLRFESGGVERKAGITRVHIEEDTGRLVHRTAADGADVSLVDLNRSGVPLMEIVGEPDLRSPEEARDYLIALRQVLRAIGASTGNMEEGAFRCDANVSVRSSDGDVVGAKVEIKNMNSFRAVERALAFEVERQTAVFQRGGKTVQETRGWVETRAVTVAQRTKEQAHDYRYFPEPDLPPLAIGAAEVERIRASLPELPLERRDRYERQYGLARSEAALLAGERALADYFEEAAGPDATIGRARSTANWMVNDLMGLQNERGLPVEEMPLPPAHLRATIEAIEQGTISQRAAKELVRQLMPGEAPLDGARRLDLVALDDEDALRTAIEETMAAFPAAVADYRGGKQAAIGRLIGETIKRTGGRANPDAVRRLLQVALEAE